MPLQPAPLQAMVDFMDATVRIKAPPQAGPLTIDELRRRHERALFRSEEAILCRPDAFRALKAALRHIHANTVDVGVYYRTARDLAELLVRLTDGYPDTIFPYFIDSLHPRRQGRADLFRFHCRDLAGQLEMLDSWRRSRRPLVRVK